MSSIPIKKNSDGINRSMRDQNNIFFIPHDLFFVMAILSHGICSCMSTSVYKFQSQPSEASVYYVNGSEKVIIGQTPIDYTKTALPNDAPFTIIFEKPGFEPKEVSVSPTENTQTTVATVLKPSKDQLTDAATKRVRVVLNKIFEIQELTARKRYVDALARLNKLEEEEPNLVEVIVMKGSIYALINDYTQAKSQWDKALKIDPTLDAVRVRLKAIPASQKGAIK